MLYICTPGGTPMNYSVEFERCADFLTRMIEKYGNEVKLPNTTQTENNAEDDTDDSGDRQITFPILFCCA